MEGAVVESEQAALIRTITRIERAEEVKATDPKLLPGLALARRIASGEFRKVIESRERKELL